MKKGLALVFLLVLLSCACASSQTVYCYPSIPQEELQGFELFPNLYALLFQGEEVEFNDLFFSILDTCECWEHEPVTTEWRDVACIGSGNLLQERTVSTLIKPLCVEMTTYFEQRETSYALCASCPEPTVLGQWQETACVNDHPLMQQRIEGYKFDSTVSNCVPVSEVRVSIDQSRPCSVQTYVTSFYGGFYLVGGIALAAGLLYWKRKKVVKWVKKAI